VELNSRTENTTTSPNCSNACSIVGMGVRVKVHLGINFLIINHHTEASPTLGHQECQTSIRGLARPHHTLLQQLIHYPSKNFEFGRGTLVSGECTGVGSDSSIWYREQSAIPRVDENNARNLAIMECALTPLGQISNLPAIFQVSSHRPCRYGSFSPFHSPLGKMAHTPWGKAKAKHLRGRIDQHISAV
jgi:hypothetical protein